MDMAAVVMVHPEAMVVDMEATVVAAVVMDLAVAATDPMDTEVEPEAMVEVDTEVRY